MSIPASWAALRHAELGRMHAEVPARRRLDAVIAAAEVDVVEIHLQYLVLFVSLLELIGEHRLVDLALHALFIGEVAEFDELLADRGRALHIGAGLEVRPGRAEDADDVHAEMVVKARVLGRDERIAHQRRDLLDADPDAVLLGVQRGDLRAVRVVQDERSLHVQDLGHVELAPTRPAAAATPARTSLRRQRAETAPAACGARSCAGACAAAACFAFASFPAWGILWPDVPGTIPQRRVNGRYESIFLPGGQQQQNARPQQLQQNSVEQSSHSVPPADPPSSA